MLMALCNVRWVCSLNKDAANSSTHLLRLCAYCMHICMGIVCPCYYNYMTSTVLGSILVTCVHTRHVCTVCVSVNQYILGQTDYVYLNGLFNSPFSVCNIEILGASLGIKAALNIMN